MCVLSSIQECGGAWLKNLYKFFSKIYLYVTACLSFCLFSKKMFSCGTLLNSQIKIGVDSLTEKFSPDFDLKAELEKGLVPSPPGSPTRKKAHR